jgi:hypothetical protein
MLTHYSPYFRNAFVADAGGRVILSADSGWAAQMPSVANRPLFMKAIASRRAGEWFVGRVFRNDASGNRPTVVFTTGIRIDPEVDGEPIAALHLAYDWDTHVAKLMAEDNLFGDATRGLCRVSILDEECRLVASSWGGQFGEQFMLGRSADRGIEMRAESIVAFARARPFECFDGLGLRCVIEQRMPSEAEVAAALAGPRRYRAA